MNAQHEGAPMNDRRRILVWLGASLVSTPLAITPTLGAEDRPPTPRVTEGPFYPRRFPADTDADLTRVGSATRRAEGTPLELTGRVLDRSGRPRAGARVEIWQCDARGYYHHVGEPDAAIDGGFQGFGAAATDGEGRYAFRTIRPVPYPGRTPHIHFIVAENGRRRLTSQLFVEGEPLNGRDGLYRELGDAARLVTVKLEPAGEGARASLEIVLA
jgi:protocatechuate 3,4-dioxygenase, beta subunit